MLLRFYWMYVTFTHGTQILGIELDLVMLWWYHVTFQDTNCYFYTGDYDRLSASTNYQWTDESLNYGYYGPGGSSHPCDAWMGGNPTAGGWRMRISYHTHDSDDTLRLSTGEVFFLSDDGSGARLSCPMDNHLFDRNGVYEFFDCYWTMWCCVGNNKL